jgi:replication factor C subunit 2/4
MLWVEKYRPKTVNSLVEQDIIKPVIMQSKKCDSLPHLLLYGPPGTGKTTTTRIICRYFYYCPNMDVLWNTQLRNERVLELNASDERGIKYVREEIKSFAQNKISYYEGIPNFKIIILDESDAMTNESQFALRMIIEKYSSNTRFIFLCNYINKIIAPIRSRMMKIRYKSVSFEHMSNVIKTICKKEGINNYDVEFMHELYNMSSGDMRSAIHMTQHLSFVNNGKMDVGIMNKIIGKIDNNEFNELICSMKTGAAEILNNINKFKGNVLCPHKLMELFAEWILCEKCDEIVRGKILMKIADIDTALHNGGNDVINIMSLCIFIRTVMNW